MLMMPTSLHQSVVQRQQKELRRSQELGITRLDSTLLQSFKKPIDKICNT